MRITVLLWITASWIGGQISEGKAGKPLYKNWRMYSVDMSGTNLVTVKKFQKTSRTLNLLTEPSEKSPRSLILIAPKEFETFENFLEKFMIKFSIVQTNVQREIDIEKRKMRKGRKRPIKFLDLNNYNSLDDINKWLIFIRDKYPDHITIMSAGKSYEKRNILAARLSHCDTNPGIFIEAGTHGREWISPAFALFLLNELLTSNDYKLKDLAYNYNWYIFPVTNPDGYVYSHEIDRFWKKTRKPYGKCYGADPNRNWNWHWNKGDGDPCGNAYPGPGPFSEPEVSSLSRFIEAIEDKIGMYISIHSYGQMIFYPFGQSSEKAHNQDHLKIIGNRGAEALASRFGTYYKVGDLHSTVYPIRGASIDWVLGVKNISLPFGFLLRPSDIFGGAFELPIDQIGSTVLETLDALVAMVHRAEELGYFPKK